MSSAAPAAPAPAPLSLTQRVLRFTERFGHMMSRVLLTLLYGLLVAPAGVVVAFLADPLRIKKWRGTSWVAWTQDNESLERARRQD